jgi:hypothetical protein
MFELLVKVVLIDTRTYLPGWPDECVKIAQILAQYTFFG